MENIGVDKVTKISVKFHKRRLTEDQDLFVREGDFVLYGSFYYEIVTLNEPKQIFGQNFFDRQFFRPKFFFNQNICPPKNCWIEQFFGPKNVSTEKYFCD